MKKPSKLALSPVQVIVAAFILSAGLRVGTHGMALAESVLSSPAEESSSVVECDSSTEMASVLESLKERQDQITIKEAEISKRRLVLDEVEKRVATEMEALKQAQEKLASTLAIADSAAEKDLLRLTEVYENMKPKDAAAIFETMDMRFAAGFLSRMKPQSAAGVLSAMTAEKAYSISVVMAGRNARAPSE